MLYFRLLVLIVAIDLIVNILLKIESSFLNTLSIFEFLFLDYANSIVVNFLQTILKKITFPRIVKDQTTIVKNIPHAQEEHPLVHTETLS